MPVVDVVVFETRFLKIVQEPLKGSLLPNKDAVDSVLKKSEATTVYSTEATVVLKIFLVGLIVRLAPPDGKNVPHVGWNDVKPSLNSQLFARTPDLTNFYFDHSYEYVCDSKSDIIAYCDYGKPVVAAISRKNIFGVQFHPEKSQMAGLKMFRSFFNMVASC